MRIFFFTALVVVLLDGLSKSLLSKVLPWKMVVIPGVFNLVKVRNPGVAFGLLATFGEKGRFVFIGLALVGLVVLVWLVRSEKKRGRQIALGMVAGGALGNAWDRFIHGAVFDFLDFHLGPYHWPAFNLADAAITLGLLLYLWGVKK